MLFYSQTPTTSSLLPLVLLTLAKVSRATLFLQELQAIAEFPPTCEAAYQTPIKGCPSAKDFSLTNPGSICSQDCYNALAQASLNIQRACQGTSAPPGTVIAHAFTGDLPYFLCSPSSGSGSGAGSSSAGASDPGSTNTSGPTTSASPSTGSVPSTSNSAAITSVSASNTDSTLTSSSPSPSSPTSTQSPTPSKSTIQSLTTSTKSTTTQTSSKTSTSTENSPRPTQSVNNGSPFDQVVPNSGYRMTSSISMFTLGIIIASTVLLGHRFI